MVRIILLNRLVTNRNTNGENIDTLRLDSCRHFPGFFCCAITVACAIKAIFAVGKTGIGFISPVAKDLRLINICGIFQIIICVPVRTAVNILAHVGIIAGIAAFNVGCWEAVTQKNDKLILICGCCQHVIASLKACLDVGKAVVSVLVAGCINDFPCFLTHGIFQAGCLCAVGAWGQPENLMGIRVERHKAYFTDAVGNTGQFINEHLRRGHCCFISRYTSKVLFHGVGNIHYDHHSNIRLHVKL